MKKIIFIVFAVFCQGIFAQEASREMSVSFNNTPLKEALLEIEKLSGFQFFFVEEWLKEEYVSGEYIQRPLQNILKDLFADSFINFYLAEDKKVILTRNNIIYDQLPQGFFPEALDSAMDGESEARSEYNPVFYDGNKTSEENVEMETHYIGKETQTTQKRHFTVSGYVREKSTGRPIPNLSVLAQGTSFGSVTDQDGYYSMQLPAGEHLLQTMSLGNEDVQKRIVIYNDGQINFDLEESLEQLGEVLLETNADKNVKSAIAGAESIDVEAIKNIPLVLGERDIMKVAATLPGISNAGEGAAGYNVRGGKTDQNLILLDDAVIYNPAHFFGLFSGINPFTTGAVNIYKGSIPAEYGGRLSSVFDIRSKSANTENFAGEASLGPVTSNLALEIPVVKEKSGLLVGGRSTYSDWILKSLDEESLKNSNASFYDVVAKYNHQFSERTSLKTTGYFSNDNFSITSDSLFSYKNRMFSVRLDHKLSDKNEAAVILSNSDYQFEIDYDSEFSNNFTTGYRIKETEAKLNLTYRHSAIHNFNYGIASKLYQMNPGYLMPKGVQSIVDPVDLSHEKGLETAFFISDNYKVSDRLLLHAGFRYSVYAALGPKEQRIYREGLPKTEANLQERREFGSNEVVETYSGPEIRLSGRFFILPDLSAKLSYNNTFQYIHTLSNNTTVSPTDTFKLSDLNIKPQRASQYSLGLYKNFEENLYELSLEGYYKKLQNILDYKVGAQLFLNEFIETEVLQGEGKSYGAEFLLKKTDGRLNGWLGYTYSRSFIKLDSEHREERVNNGDFFPANYDKPHDFSMVANYKLTQRFSFSANFMYQTGRPVTFPVGKYRENGTDYVLYSNRNQFRIPDYYRLDLSFNVEGNHKIEKLAHSFWNISVYNVLGRNNPYSVFFVTDNGEIKAYQSSIFSIPVPTITYNFKF